MLAEISSALSSTDELDRVIPRVLDKAADTLGAVGVGVTLIEPGGGWHIAYSSGVIAAVARPTFEDEAVVTSSEVARTGEPVIIGDALDCDLTNPGIAEQLGYRAMVIHPLTHGSRIIGAISFLFDHPRPQIPPPELEAIARLSFVLTTAFEAARLNQEIRESEKRSAALARQRQLALDAAQLGWWQYDPISRISEWDDGYRAIFGVGEYTRPNDEILTQIIHHDDLAALWAKVEAALNPDDPQPYFAQYRIIRPDGALRWIEAHGAATFEGEGAQREAVNFVGTVADITERKAAEEALRESERRVRRKLDAILAPEGDISQLDLADIIDVVAIQSLMDEFYAISHVPISIIDLKGRILVGSGWQRVCLEFHRMQPETRKYCEESDSELTVDVAPGDVKLYKCKNGMWDMVTPIFIGGEKVGNLFSGQFFFDDEEPDRGWFAKQARKYGFDEDAYLAAIDEAPRLSRRTVETATTFLTDLSNLLSKLSYSNVRLAGSLAERDALTESLRLTGRDLERAQEVASVGSWRLDTRADVLTWSDEVYRMFHVPIGESLTYESFIAAVHPDDRTFVDEQWTAALGGAPYDIEHRIIVGDRVKWVREHAELEFSEDGGLLGGFGIVHDITGRKSAEIELQRESQEIATANRLLGLFVEESGDALFDKALDIVMEATGSEQGVFGYMDERGDLVCPTMTRLFDKCETDEADKCAVYKQHKWTGLWGSAIRERATLCSNERKAVPKGHVPIESNLASAIVLGGEAIGLINLANKPGGYTEDDRLFVEHVSGRIAPVLFAWKERKIVEAERDERARLNMALNAIVTSFSTTFDTDEILQQSSRAAFEALHVDSAALVSERAGEWTVTKAWSLEGAEGWALAAEDFDVATLGVGGDEPIVIPDVNLDARVPHELLAKVGIRSLLGIPFKVEGLPFAVLSLHRCGIPAPFSEPQVDFASRLMAAVSLALERARQFGREHEIAETLQEAILTPPASIEGLEIAYLYRPASASANVGGDFYDVFEAAEGRVAILIGDVSGKGVEAARFTALMRDGAKAYALDGNEPHVVLTKLNRLAFESTPLGSFATALFAYLDVDTGRLTYCGAGHPSGVILTEGQTSLLESRCVFLGAFKEARYEGLEEASLGRDMLVLYTDGLTEARCGSEFFGERRVLDALGRLRGTPVHEMPEKLLGEALSFADRGLRDDVIVLCVQRTGPSQEKAEESD